MKLQGQKYAAFKANNLVRNLRLPRRITLLLPLKHAFIYLMHWDWEATGKLAVCSFFTTKVLLASHFHDSMEQGNTLLSLVFAGDRYDSRYVRCSRYDWGAVLSGFWQNQRDIFGSAYAAALAFGIIEVILGGINVIFVSACVLIPIHSLDSSCTNIW